VRYFNTLFCFSWPSLSIIFACLLGSACTMRADDVCDVTGGVGEGEISWLAGAVDKGSCSGAATMVIPQGTQWFSFAHNTFGPYYAAQIADPPENPLHVSFNLTVSSPKGTLYNLTASSIVSGYQLVPGFCPSGNGQTCTHLTQNASMLPTLESGSIFVGDQTKNGDLSLQLSLTATWETSAEWLIQMFLWSPTRTAALLDPFPELTDSTGMHLLTESQAETLSRYGRPVQAVSADQATRTILRIPA